ncbi:hypothetical protein GS491_20105 [Rhodococcus hoagii]|nr:histone-like nucleoid-structuring protein Lsr2 [Prescottella equi]MBM4536116.1 hypothetical protein [Prescottella equi]NKR79624.1 hypothetical protein [Prescottella equi]NKR81287.1 hypothetical protein [Prescottella equi]NKT03116.1 hypothetical protein [Prescottella equi]
MLKRARTEQAREWANANGFTVSARGRLAVDVMEAKAASN